MFGVLSLFSLHANSFVAGTMFFIALMVKTKITINEILEYKKKILNYSKFLKSTREMANWGRYTKNPCLIFWN
jgi:hypothetical protein